MQDIYIFSLESEEKGKPFAPYLLPEVKLVKQSFVQIFIILEKIYPSNIGIF